MPRLDRAAIGTGAITGLTIGVVTILAYRGVDAAVDPGDDSLLPIAFSLVIVFGWFLGGAVAAMRDTETPLTSGAVSALLSMLVIAVVSTAIRLATDESIAWGTIVFFAAVAVTAGVVGAVLATTVTRKQGT
jgi:hypothetical protein